MARNRNTQHEVDMSEVREDVIEDESEGEATGVESVGTELKVSFKTSSLPGSVFEAKWSDLPLVSQQAEINRATAHMCGNVPQSQLTNYVKGKIADNAGFPEDHKDRADYIKKLNKDDVGKYRKDNADEVRAQLLVYTQKAWDDLLSGDVSLRGGTRLTDETDQAENRIRTDHAKRYYASQIPGFVWPSNAREFVDINGKAFNRDDLLAYSDDVHKAAGFNFRAQAEAEIADAKAKLALLKPIMPVLPV